MNKDIEQINLLSIFHYVVGGIAALFACFPFIHLAIGIGLIIASKTPSTSGETPPAFIGWIFVGIATVIILAGWALAVCTIISGRYLSKQRHYKYCMVIACLLCLFVPFGTILGIFTIFVLARPSVKEIFQQAPAN